MRVLWFTTSPSLAEHKEVSSNITGGWIKSEEKALKFYHPDIQLGVVFPSKKNSDPYEIENTQYFPIRKSRPSKFHKVLFRSNIRKSVVESQKRQYLEIIRDFQPDLIHIHGTENNFGVVVAGTSIPVVLSVQGIVSVCAHKYFSGISRHEAGRNIFSLNNKFLIQYNDYRYLVNLEIRTLQNVRFLFGRTSWDKRVGSVLAPRAKYFHIDRVLRDVFYENEWNPHVKEETILVTTLRSSLFKGFEVIPDAARLLLDLNVKFKWKIIGLNKTDLLVKMMHSKLGRVSEKIVFLGKLNDGEIVNELLNSDIFIHTSHIENSPNAVAEALAIGMPVIASFAGGTGSLLTDKKDGLLIQDGDPWVLAGAVLELINNRHLAADLGKAARMNSLIRHNPRAIADKIFSAYQEIIKEEKNHD